MNYKKGAQTRGCMKSVMQYVAQKNKTLWNGVQLISGIGCQPETAFDEFLSTKHLHHKDGGVMFYHMVQSFPKGVAIDPRTAHEAARWLAGYFEGCEILICTHTDREHIHSHCIINSVNFETGRKVHMADEQIQDTQDHISKKYLWDATMIARILRDESYVGTLICHKSERNKINKTFRFTEPEEQFRHENYLPPIITPELWEQTQMMLAERKRLNVRAAPSQEILRYSGLLRCEDCGRAMFGKRIHLKSGERVTYVCSTYNRFGKEHCSQHQIEEAALDKLIMDELKNTKVLYQQNWDALEQLIAQWTPKAELTGAQIIKLEKKICCLEDETEVILMERIRDRANAERYDRMIQKREEEIAAAKKQIEELQNISAVLRDRQTKLKRDISMIDDILAEGAMTEAHLRMLVEKIYVQETDGKLSLDIQIKAPFRTHLDVYENGTLTERYGALDFDWDRLARLLYGDGLVG